MVLSFVKYRVFFKYFWKKEYNVIVKFCSRMGPADPSFLEL